MWKMGITWQANGRTLWRRKKRRKEAYVETIDAG